MPPIHCFTQNSWSNARIMAEQSQPSTSWAAIIHFWRREISFWGSPKHLCGFCSPHLHCAQWSTHVSLKGNSIPISRDKKNQSVLCPKGALLCFLIRVNILLPHTHLFRAELCVALPQFAWSAFNDCIAEHCNHHHEEEVTGVHEMQVY